MPRSVDVNVCINFSFFTLIPSKSELPADNHDFDVVSLWSQSFPDIDRENGAAAVKHRRQR